MFVISFSTIILLIARSAKKGAILFPPRAPRWRKNAQIIPKGIIPWGIIS